MELIGLFLFTIQCCFCISEAESLRCRCSTHSCPGDHDNGTCTTEGKCFKKVEPGEDDTYELITYGCLPPEEQTLMQCNTPDHVHTKQLSMECCRDADMCNTLLQPSLPTTPTPTTGTVLLILYHKISITFVKSSIMSV